MGDQVIIKVGSSSSPGRIAGAIAHAIYEGNAVQVRAIGASAVNQAIKSIIIAKGYTAERGCTIYIDPEFGSIPDENTDRNTTIIIMNVLEI